MTSTIIALILFVLLLVTLELGRRPSSKATEELKAAQRDISILRDTLEVRTKEVRYYAFEVGTKLEIIEIQKGRIDNLCEQLEESRLAAFANLSDMTRLSALQQENKLDALCEVIKTLMQRDQLCDAAVASFGGRLSRAVQVYRKDRLKAVPCMIPGAAHFPDF